MFLSPLKFTLIYLIYATALKLLRCGATVIVTTRFPRHALLSFAKEPDFGDWRDRLKLYHIFFLLFVSLSYVSFVLFLVIIFIISL